MNTSLKRDQTSDRRGRNHRRCDMYASNAPISEHLRLANLCAADAKCTGCKLPPGYIDTFVGLRVGAKTYFMRF